MSQYVENMIKDYAKIYNAKSFTKEQVALDLLESGAKFDFVSQVINAMQKGV